MKMVGLGCQNRHAFMQSPNKGARPNLAVWMQRTLYKEHGEEVDGSSFVYGSQTI